MIKIKHTEYLSKPGFLKAYPTLNYGKTKDYFVVMTPDDKVCALASLSFPRYQNILKRYDKHTLVEKPIHLSEYLHCILVGTPLQIDVWKALMNIPLGKTVSYQDLAIQIGKPKAFRAVANAVGANPISPLIPCHRVVRKSGDLGGYYWGIDAKKKLLREEGLSILEA